MNADHQVTVFDNLSEGHRVAVDERAQFIEGCLSDRETILNAVAADQPEAVMHFAAFAQVGESMTDPSKYFRNNVANGINLLDAAVEAGVRKFIFSSTAATYGMPDTTVPITEQEPQKPINPYGESKLMFESILKWYHELHRLEFVAFRYFNAAGCSEKLGEQRRVETQRVKRDRVRLHDRCRHRWLGRGRRESLRRKSGSPVRAAHSVVSPSWSCTGGVRFQDVG